MKEICPYCGMKFMPSYLNPHKKICRNFENWLMDNKNYMARFRGMKARTGRVI